MKIGVELDFGRKPTTTSAITTVNDLRFNEWTECRAIIARLDAILVDLRKVGFAFVTALLTASTFLSLHGVTAQNVPDTPVQARAAAFTAIMVLIGALFLVDSYYEVLLSAAVERTLDLEAQTDPPVRITKYLSINTHRSRVSDVTHSLYAVLLATAGTLGLIGVLGASDDLKTRILFAVVVAIFGGFLYFAMMRYSSFIERETHFREFKTERKWRPGEGLEEKVAAP
jgi:hypothetical protein